MQAPRHNLYNVIHKALRAMQYDLGARFAMVDPLDNVTLDQLIRRAEVVCGFIDEHAHHEQTFIHPLLRAASPELAHNLDHDHDELHRDAEQMLALLRDLATLSGQARLDAMETLRWRFEKSLAAHLDHFAIEEREGNAILWEHYNDEALRAAQGQLQASIAPARFAEWLNEMLPAMNVTDHAGMWLGMRAHAPDEAVAGFEATVVRFFGQPGLDALKERAVLLATR